MGLKTKIKKLMMMLGSGLIGVSSCMVSVTTYGAEQIIKESQMKEDLTQETLETFSDSLFQEAMEKYTIPGGVLTVVKDGEVMLSKGYGYTDLKTKEQVSPSRTLFRIGSVTKLFTATAAMQLVEAGKVLLDEPVNEYIQGFQLPTDYKKPITLKHLLTHTSGLDDTVIGDLAKEAAGIKDLTTFYADYHWKSVRAPGTIIQYNNRGIGAVGAIVEQLSQTPYKTYIEEKLFKPLQMNRSSLDIQKEDLSKGYTYSSLTKKITEDKLEGYFNLAPVGGILSTGQDMSHFMIAQLSGGRFKGQEILSPETTTLMQKRQFGLSDYLLGNTYGFHENYTNGLRILEQGGYSPDGFLTELALIPEEHIGIFVSINQGSNNTFPQDYLTAFVKYYFKERPRTVKQQVVHESSARQVEGVYRSSDYSQTDLCKGDLLGMGNDVRVKANSDGTITVTEEVTSYFDSSRKMVSWKGIEIAPYTYKNSKEDSYIAFKENSKGIIYYMSKSADSSMAAYERIHWYDQNIFQVVLFSVLLLIALMEVVIWIIRICIRGIKRLLKKQESTKNLLVGEYLGTLIMFLNLGFYIISLFTWGTRMHYGVPLDVKLDLMLLIVATALTPLLVGVNIRDWYNKRGRLGARLHVSFVVGIAIVFIWFNYYWNFLGFNF